MGVRISRKLETHANKNYFWKGENYHEYSNSDSNRRQG